MFKKIDLDLNKKSFIILNYLKKNIADHYSEVYEDMSAEDDELKILDFFRNQRGIYRHEMISYQIMNHFPRNILKKILKKEKPRAHWQIFEKGKSAAPHIDNFRLCALNIYIQTNNEKTVFYNPLRSGVKIKSKIHGWTNNQLFLYDWLEETGSFIAKNNDIYLLDVTKPHSVLDMDIGKPRISLSLSFLKTSFEELCTIIS